MPPLSRYEDHLSSLASADRRRSLATRTGVDFASNDYLGLAGSPRLAEAVGVAVRAGVPVGSGGSRLLRGNCAQHEALEATAARYFGSEASLFFATGYAANSALFSTLPQSGDLLLYDELIHASAHEGMRLGRAATQAIPHNDITAFDDAIALWRRRGAIGQPWIAVESLYSMDGDRAPLDELTAVAERHEAMLLVDEAHATGVFGPGGRGLASALDGHPNVVVLRTCGKAMGCEGALVCAPQTICDFLINRGRGFIFSTAPSPLMACAVMESLRILADEPERRDRLNALVKEAEAVFQGCGVTPTGSQIMPLMVGDDAATMRLAASVRAAGFDVRGIRPPTVPAGTSRLRISLTLNVTAQDVRDLAAAIGAAQ